MLKIAKELPTGDIQVHELPSKEYPGIAIGIDGTPAVRVEYNTETQQYGIYVWDGKKEDFVHKTVFEKPSLYTPSDNQ